ADDELEIGNEIDDELAVRANGLAQRLSPPGELRLAPAQKRTDKALEGGRYGRVGDVALVLVELPGCKEGAWADQPLMQLVHHRGFADAGIAGDEHELGAAHGHDTMEGLQQAADLALPPVEPLRDQHSIRCIPGPQREGLDPADRFPFRQAALQVAGEAG